MGSNFDIDFDREKRAGFKEVVYAEKKSVDTLTGIIDQFRDKNSSVLLTCLSVEKQAELSKRYAPFFYDKTSRVAIVGEFEEIQQEPLVGIISAGTSDEFVVNEAYYTLQYMGVPVQKIQDIGVAGIHRFTQKLQHIKQFKIVIVVAGFEGALASVAGGLLPQPIIAVPTSVGSGIAKDGTVALHAMLASCANGITVVNIDNGYGAAMAAKRILQSFV